MKLDCSAEMKTLDGKSIVKDADDKSILTFRDVIVNALLSSTEQEKNITGEEKFKRYALAKRAYDLEVFEITTEEAVLIKKLVSLIYAPLIVGQAWNIIEGKKGDKAV
jgi:hypothetical protein